MPIAHPIADAARFLFELERRPRASGRNAPREAMKLLLAECVRLCGATHGSIWLPHHGEETMRLHLGLAGEERRLAGFRLRRGEGIAGFCARVGQPIVVNDVGSDARHSPRADQLLSFETRQMLSCPLVRRGRIVGTLNIVNRRAELDPNFSEHETLVAMLFASALAERLFEAEIEGYSLDDEPKGEIDGEDAPIPIFASGALEEAAALIRLARERSILFTGETGVGKDLLARYAHSRSRRAAGPFVNINCATLQESLWESEFFGHARGAFTGAARDKPGLIEAANGGTLFLNEIGEMPMTAQAKLLTFLDSGEFQRVGETRWRKIRARIMAATNQNLEEAIETRRFRRDVYHRLAQVRVHIPPLRERKMDIVALTVYRLDALARRDGGAAPWIDDAARALITSLPWEGNVRDLFAAVDSAYGRAREMGETSLSPVHFPAGIAPAAALAARSAPPPHEAAVWELTRLLGRFSRGENHASPPAPVSTTHARAARGIFERPEDLRKILDETRCLSSGRRNASAAYRRLAQAGEIEMSFQTFLRRLRLMKIEAD